MKLDWPAIVSANIRRRAGKLALSALFLSTCSACAMTRTVAQSADDPFLDEPALSRPAAEPAASRKLAAAQRRSMSRVSQAGFETEAAPEAQLPAGAIQWTSAEPRVPAVFECPVVDESPGAMAKLYPDEYLFDGGDREQPIHYEQMEMAGLDSSDAAIEYRDLSGKVRIKPTNRVALYSPRFGSVTTVSQPVEGVGGGRPVQSIARVAQEGLGNREATFAHHQRDGAERMLTRSRGSGLAAIAAADAVDAPVSPMGHAHTAVVVGNFSFVRTGQFKQTDEPWLAESIDSAQVWTRDQNPVILAKSERAREVKSEFSKQEMVGQENRFNGKERLRIVKLADKSVAGPGEVVTFTIRFDNIGDRPVTDVTIIDNLTPRLEYVDQSATCDRDGKLVVEDNTEGSLVLRWELDEPLGAHSGGVVTFQARVR